MILQYSFHDKMCGLIHENEKTCSPDLSLDMDSIINWTAGV